MPARKNKPSLWRGLSRGVRLLLIGANVVAALLLVACAWSTHVSPVHWPWLSSFALTFPAYLAANMFFLALWLVFRWRHALISLAALVLSWGSVRAYFPVNVPNPHPKDCIKVMTYNVWGFAENDHVKKKNKKFEQVLDYLSKSDADVVCFQEYVYWANRDGHKVEEALRSNWRYIDSVHVGNENFMGICSRYPIVDREIIMKYYHTHGAVAYRLKVGKDTVTVINSHFVSNHISGDDKVMYKEMVTRPRKGTWLSNLRYLGRKLGRSGALRAVQVDSVAAYVARHCDKPLVLCGDFNEPPVAYAHYRLTRHLRDAYAATATGPGVTYHESDLYFRLDNILCSKHLKPYGAYVDTGIATSDHYPVAVYLQLKTN